MRRRIQFSVVLGLSLSVVMTASARIDVTGEPRYGTHTLESGFEPDPTSYSVVAGGDEHTNQLEGCDGGWVSDRPDLRINFEAGSLPLRFYVASTTDTTLAINLPDGSWVCNDDGSGLNPIVDFRAPKSGQYDIFVGVADEGKTARVNVMATEVPDDNGPGGGGGTIDISGEPRYGTHTLRSGFEPDPTSYSVVAGGDQRSSQLGGCDGGWVADRPDLRINFEAGSLPLRFYVSSRTDTTLADNLPDGTWVCNDDASGLNPIIDLKTPKSGQYDIFVGVADEGTTARVNVMATEVPDEHGP